MRVREKAHTREGDAIAAARRRLPMVEVDGATPLIGEHGAVTLLDAFEGRRMLIAYYFMWYAGQPAPEQCEGCTFFTSQVRELSYHSFARRHLRHALPGPVRREHPVPRLHGLGDALVLGAPDVARHAPGRAHGRHDSPRLLPATGIRCLRDLLDDGRGVEAMDNTYRLLDLTVYGRQEEWEDSPAGWPHRPKASRISVSMDVPSPSGLA